MVSIGHYPHENDLVGQGMALEREIRGGLLVAAIMIERALDLIIATHLSEGNHQDFINTYFQMLSRSEDGTPTSAINWFKSRCKNDRVISGSEQLMKVARGWRGVLSDKVKIVVSLLKEGYPVLLKGIEIPENGEDPPSLERQLTAFVQLRNDVAHTEPANNVDPVKGQRPDRIIFVDYIAGQRKFRSLTLVDAQTKEKEWKELGLLLGGVASDIDRLRARFSITRPGT